MATYTFSLVSVCAGGGHAVVEVTQNGGPTVQHSVDVERVLTALSVDKKKALIEPILQLHLQGMTKLQARNAMQAGFTVTI